MNHTASKLQELWENGVEITKNQEKILTDLNKGFSKEVKAICEIKLRRFGFKTVQQKAQVTVIMIEQV